MFAREVSPGGLWKEGEEVSTPGQMSVKFIRLHVTVLIKVSGLSAACEHTHTLHVFALHTRPPLLLATAASSCFL